MRATVAILSFGMLLGTARAEDPRIRIIGDGYTQLVELKEASGNIGVGIAYDTDGEDGVLLIRKGLSDAITDDRAAFGRFLLSPGDAKTSAYIRFRRIGIGPLNWLARKALGDGDTKGGIYVEGQAASTTWVIHQASPDPAVTEPMELQETASAFSASAGVSLRTKPRSVTQNKLQFTLSAGPALHAVQGDASRNEEFRRAALGTSDATAYGAKLDGELIINDVYATATASWMSGDIKGLSGGQFIVALGFRGGIDVK